MVEINTITEKKNNNVDALHSFGRAHDAHSSKRRMQFVRIPSFGEDKLWKSEY